MWKLWVVIWENGDHVALMDMYTLYLDSLFLLNEIVRDATIYTIQHAGHLGSPRYFFK